MIEQFPAEASPERRVHDIELARIGAMIVEASQRSDLSLVATNHVGNTGIDNPNSVGSTGFFVAGDVPMSDTSIYRQVGVEAVEDLAASGIVRNGATARGEQHPRWGDRVFWHPGDHEKMMPTGGRAVIEADKSAAEAGWVTANQVKGIYAKDSDGLVKNILPSDFEN